MEREKAINTDNSQLKEKSRYYILVCTLKKKDKQKVCCKSENNQKIVPY